MTDERLEELLRDAARTYRVPSEVPREPMWQHIERAAFRARDRRPLNRLLRNPWFPVAAALVIGIGVGRWSTRSSAGARTADGSRGGASRNAPQSDTAFDGSYQDATSRYLGQTTALLVALPSEVKAGRADGQFLARAGELLTTTRLLLDSPAANDARMRALLEDLELVLAQVVRLQHDQGRTEVDLINQALEQRDVIPRLRTAVADASASN